MPCPPADLRVRSVGGTFFQKNLKSGETRPMFAVRDFVRADREKSRHPMDAPPLPPPTFDHKPVVQHVVAAQPKSSDAQWGRPIFKAPELKSFAPRAKSASAFSQRPSFKGRVRDKRSA